MSYQQVRHPAIPTFESMLLDGITAAMSRRAKAIKYQTHTFSCTRSVDDEQNEKMELCIETYGIVDGRPINIACTIWANGDLWLSICQNMPRRVGGAATLYAGNGRLNGVEADTVATLIEELKSKAYELASSTSTPQQLEHRWKLISLSQTP